MPDVTPPRCVEQCVTIRPTMEEFQNEMAFLSSTAVQEAGKRCGIVRVVTPREFEPSKELVTVEDSVVDPSIWAAKVPVVEQHFPTLTGRARGEAGFYQVARRNAEQYELDTAEWRAKCLLWKEKTLEQMAAKHPMEPIPTDPRQLYWKSRPYQNKAFYGADVQQTVMKPDQKCWNFTSPDFPCLTKLITSEEIPGINTPYLYIGSWGSTFGLHPEDRDLYSLNYLHEGDSKFWYGMPSSVSADVERYARLLLPAEAKHCPQFLRHKTLLIEPRHFIQRGIPVYAAEQKEGDLMITFPNAYHYGFNSGFNVAEARNIATSDWIPFGLKAEPCVCAGYGGPSAADILPRQMILQMAKLQESKCVDSQADGEDKSADDSAVMEDVPVKMEEEADEMERCLKQMKRARHV